MAHRYVSEFCRCPDGQYFAEYYDNLDLAGSPIATQCELDIPDWRWHSCCDGKPDAMGDSGSVRFSARWSSRIEAPSHLSDVIFSTYASGGSRVILDKVIVLDAWDESGSTFDSEPVATGAGSHTLAYEYRSARTAGDVTTNSFAKLSWSSGFNATERVSGDRVYALVGWLAVADGSGSIHGEAFVAGYAQAVNLVVDVSFSRNFEPPPLVFAGYHATDFAEGGHLRLIDANPTGAAIALEYDSCEVVPEGSRMVGWMALATPSTTSIGDTRIHQRPTLPSDVTALLAMSTDLRLPAYLRWHNGSDPCRDRWAGIECRADGGQAPRVVVVDIVSAARLVYLCCCVVYFTSVVACFVRLWGCSTTWTLPGMIYRGMRLVA